MTYGVEPLERDASRPVLSPGAAVEDLRRRLVRFAVKLVWNRDDADELVQEAFKTASAKGIGLYEDRFMPWMYRTTANLCANHRRRQQPVPLPEGALISPDESAAARAMRAERLTQLRDAIEALPTQQRLAITMRWMEHLDYDRIASIMAISESAVRAHVHQARRRLSECLREIGDADV